MIDWYSNCFITNIYRLSVNEGIKVRALQRTIITYSYENENDLISLHMKTITKSYKNKYHECEIDR